jgi:hypothetical protein
LPANRAVPKSLFPLAPKNFAPSTFLEFFFQQYSIAAIAAMGAGRRGLMGACSNSRSTRLPARLIFSTEKGSLQTAREISAYESLDTSNFNFKTPLC